MSTSPLRPTSEVFDESVLKVEFLPLPTQIPDFSLNLNTESLYNRLQTIMQEIVGPIRVQGFSVHLSGGNMLVDTGLILHKNYIVRLLAQQSFALVASPHVVYATITEHLLTSVSDPDIVNINPPLAAESLPGPNQYRFTIAIGYGVSVPADTAGVVHVKICDVSATGVVTNLLPLYTKKLGAYDLATMEAAPAIVDARVDVLTTRMESIEASTVGHSVVCDDTAMAAGDFFKLVDNSGAKAKKLTCSMFPSITYLGMTPDSNTRHSQTVKLSSTTVATVFGDGSDTYLVVGTNTAGTMSYTLPVSMGLNTQSFAVGALDSTHIALVFVVGNTAYTRVYAINAGGASVSATVSTITIGLTAGYNYVSVAVLDATHYVPVTSYHNSNGYVRGTVVTYSTDISAGEFYDKATTQGYYPTMFCEAAVALDSTNIFVGFKETTYNKVYGLVGQISGNVITWGDNTINSDLTWGADPNGVSTAKLSSTVVAIVSIDGSYNIQSCCATISGTTITWKPAANWGLSGSNWNWRQSIAGLDATHFAVTAYEAGGVNKTRVRVASIDGSYNITFGTAVTVTTEANVSIYTMHLAAFDSTNFLITFYDYNVNFGTFGQPASVSGVAVTLGNSSLAIMKIPTMTEYAALDVSNAVMVSQSGASVYVRLLALSGNAFALNGVGATITGYDGGGARIAGLSATSFVVFFNNSTSVKCRICTVAGSVITVGNEYTVSTSSTDGGPGSFRVIALTSTKFLATYYGGSTIYARVATVSETTPTFGSEATIATWGADTTFTGWSNSVAHDSSFATVFTTAYDNSVTPHEHYVEATGIYVNGTACGPQGVQTKVMRPQMTPTIISAISATKVGNFVVVKWQEYDPGVPGFQDVIHSFKIVPNTGYILPVDMDRMVKQSNNNSGVIGLSATRFALAYASILGQAFITFKLTDSGGITHESAPSIFAGGASDANQRAIALSSSVGILPTSEVAFTHFIDDRQDAIGVMLEAATTGQTKLAALAGGMSWIHSSLVPGARYGLSTALALVRDEAPFVGVAISATQLKLKGVL